jgi:hypothetical protein
MAIHLGERARQFAENHLRLPKRKIPTYGYENISDYNGRYRLNIKLGKLGFGLPLVHLNFPGVEEGAIGWFDPNPEVNKDIDREATKVMADMLKRMEAKVVVMTNSTKSENFIREAVKKLPRGTRLILLPSGSEEEKGAQIEELSVGELVGYTPVTGTKKVMGYPKPVGEDKKYLTLDELKKICPDGKGLVIADDVYTTGETVKAMETVLGLTEKSKHQVAVIAIEKKFDGQYRETSIPKNVHGAFELTEFVNLDNLGINRAKLHEYNKKTIPHAVVQR